MPKISIDTLRQQLRANDIKPVYVLYGPEGHLRNIVANTIADRCFGEGDLRDFNDSTFSLEDPENIRDALASADQLPMMAARRAVRVVNVRVSSTAANDTLKEQHEQLVAGYLENPNPTSVLIFVGEELNGNRKLAKLLEKHAVVVEFKPLEGKELFARLAKMFQEEGVTAEPEAIRYLISMTDPDLVKLSTEIKKLAAASMPEGKISVELVEQFISRTREVDNFSLTGHLIGRRPKQAAIALAQMLNDGAEPLMLLGLLGSNYRRLIIAKEMMDQGRDRREVANSVRLRYSDQEAFFAAARRTPMQDLLYAVGRIADVDLAIKNSLGGGTYGARMQMEMLVCDLASLN
ncbi:DNA polymerase III subunit delta [Leptolyngbya sp. 7M]|uniref:DNA polymerase III subunit delta n=1 Tax=Leptolyngbya sp. 7M TaxID=2812896 RepID=UPI001B8CEDF1|nr:DNA polymerase III subunit delta [Leptolyngbya sp. 7M]QYO66277.1 DNA polymerase III subunit delta [Leptolyngbya sp. 7M]